MQYILPSLEIDDDEREPADNKEVMQRHFKALQKEMQKKKPDVEVVNVYLNKEFQGRHNWLRMIPAAERCKELLDAYPCFKNYVEVIEIISLLFCIHYTEKVCV